MPKVSQSHLDARRRQILDAAVECFAREGFHQTTMQDIVAQSALSPGAIYTYFKSKEDIIEAIARERNGRDRDLMLAARQHSAADAGFRQLIHDFFQTLRVDPEERKLRRLGIQIWAEALRNPRILELVRRGIDEAHGLFTDMVAQAQQRNELPATLSAGATARVMMALFLGFIVQQAWDDEVEVDPYVEVLDAIVEASRASAQREK